MTGLTPSKGELYGQNKLEKELQRLKKRLEINDDLKVVWMPNGKKRCSFTTRL